VLRIVIACLVLAFGFAAFAQPTPSGPLLIDSIEQKLGHFRSSKERAKKRNEAEMRKLRERMKRQADQRDKRKDWGR
jgi:hypothetical protein